MDRRASLAMTQSDDKKCVPRAWEIAFRVRGMRVRDDD